MSILDFICDESLNVFPTKLKRNCNKWNMKPFNVWDYTVPASPKTKHPTSFRQGKLSSLSSTSGLFSRAAQVCWDNTIVWVKLFHTSTQHHCVIPPSGDVSSVCVLGLLHSWDEGRRKGQRPHFSRAVGVGGWRGEWLMAGRRRRRPNRWMSHRNTNRLDVSGHWAGKLVRCDKTLF